MEFKAEITADHCQTTAKKRALFEELCSDVCLELWPQVDIHYCKCFSCFVPRTARTHIRLKSGFEA